MFASHKKISAEIYKALSLSSVLSTEEQIRLLELLGTTVDQTRKQDLIKRAFIGERVWDEKKAG